MREIKFKGRRKDNGEWVYGSLYSQYGTYIFIIVRNLDHPADLCTSLSHIRGDFKEVIPETVGQFTGLFDKNRKESYESDKCNAKYNARGMGINVYGYPIIFDSGRFGLQGKDGEWLCSLSYLNEFEVIGNIHENPELIEEKPK